jgi:hypothetical protein
MDLVIHPQLDINDFDPFAGGCSMSESAAVIPPVDLVRPISEFIRNPSPFPFTWQH